MCVCVGGGGGGGGGGRWHIKMLSAVVVIITFITSRVYPFSPKHLLSKPQVPLKIASGAQLFKLNDIVS